MGVFRTSLAGDVFHRVALLLSSAYSIGLGISGIVHIHWTSEDVSVQEEGEVMDILKSKKTQRWQGKALVGVVAVLLMKFGAITPASAAIHSGTKGCPGQFGYLKGTTVGATELAPPGSY